MRVTDKVVGDLLICGSEQFPYWAKGHRHIAPLVRAASEFSARLKRRRDARPDSDGQGACLVAPGTSKQRKSNLHPVQILAGAILVASALTLPARAQISPGPLSRPHQSLNGLANCTSCHRLGGVPATSGGRQRLCPDFRGRDAAQRFPEKDRGAVRNNRRDGGGKSPGQTGTL